MNRFAVAGIVAAVASASMSLIASPSANAGSCTIAAVGDVAGPGDYKTGAAKTAALIRAEDPDRVVALGDLAYDDGTVTEFAKYYHPTWGSLGSKVEAVPGNHDVHRGPQGMIREFGASSVTNRGVNACGWRVIVVNQYDDLGKAAAFVTADAKAHPNVPKIIAWHEPRFSSGSEHGSNSSMQPLWAAATAAGARIVLNAHDHNYERFAPMEGDGSPVGEGTRQFVSGLGGHHIRGIAGIRANSEKRYTGQPAVLFLVSRVASDLAVDP